MCVGTNGSDTVPLSEAMAARSLAPPQVFETEVAFLSLNVDIVAEIVIVALAHFELSVRSVFFQIPFPPAL